MSNARRLAGGALIATGIAIGVLTVRTATGARAQAEAAIRAGAEAAAARAAEARKGVEARAREATTIPALRAALDSRVDAATLIDLFDNEDWWVSYRNEFALVRVIADGEMVAARGRLPLGKLDAPVIEAAREHEVASAVVTVDGQPVHVAAARFPEEGSTPQTALIVLASPVVSVAPTAVRLPELADHALHFVLAGAIGLAGLGLLLSGGRPAQAQVTTDEIVHETTAKMGSALGNTIGSMPASNLGSSPGSLPGHTLVIGAPAPVPPTELLAAPPHPPGWITDGAAVQIHGAPPAPAPRPAAPALAPTMVAVPATAMLPTPPGRSTVQFNAPAPPRASSSPFGRYRLRDRLGEGGMSEIFLADATGAEGFKRTFVLKRLRPDLARDESAVAQFVDEARLQASLIHPNIVPVLDFGVIHGEYFMAQEYVAGRDLGKLMARYQGTGDAPLPTPAAYHVAHETLQALAFAHEMTDRNGAALGIVHRDVSVGNLLVSLQGEIKLIDFGIVKSNDRVNKTQVGLVKGNVNFMSPEQARGQVVDLRSDLFSLGLVLHYVLTGRMLYGAGNDLGMLYQASNGPTPADYNRIRALPEPAAAILEKALAFDPNERFQTAGEFADALAAHSGGGRTIAAKLMQRLFSEEIRGEIS